MEFLGSNEPNQLLPIESVDKFRDDWRCLFEVLSGVFHHGGRGVWRPRAKAHEEIVRILPGSMMRSASAGELPSSM